jgi:predicted RNA-binding Zn ribbon-like protein
VNELLGIISRDAIDVFTGPYRNRIRQCASPRCAVIFVDRSRAGNRRWCAMSPCGDQASARAYRQRKKTAL